MRVRSFLPLLLLGAVAAGVASVALSEDKEKILEVRYYDPREYAGADMPFVVSPPERLLESQVTAKRIRRVVLLRDVIIEVCVLVQDPETKVWRGPKGLQERKKYCFAYQ
jgi:hypothetical protein